MKTYLDNQEYIDSLIANQSRVTPAQHLAVFVRACEALRAAMTDREHLWGRSKRDRLWSICVTIRNRLRQHKEQNDQSKIS